MTSRGLSVRHILEQGATAGPVIGLDTGGPVATLGVVCGGQIMAVLVRELSSHCAGLPAAVEEVLEAAEVPMDALAAIAVAVGPGSFTGLRVGLSYAKGLAIALKLAIAGVSTLDAMALCVPQDMLKPGVTVCPILDARKGEVYASLYEVVSDTLKKSTGDLVFPLNHIERRITGAAIFIGDSKAEEACAWVVANGGHAEVAGSAGLHLRGSYIAALGAAKVVCEEADSVVTLEPVYVRAADAAVNSRGTNSGGRDNGTLRGRTRPAACRP